MAKKLEPTTVDSSSFVDINEASKIGYWEFAVGNTTLKLQHNPSDKYTYEGDYGIYNKDKTVTLNSIYRNKANGQLKIVKNIITNWGDYFNAAQVSSQYTLGEIVNILQTDKNNLHQYNEEGMIFDNSSANYDEWISGSLKNNIYHLTKIKPGKKDIVFDEKGNDIYNVYNGTNTTSFNELHDLAGNDRYNLMSKKTDGEDYVKDYAGNDNYSLLNNTDVRIDDLAGNDNYSVKEKSKLNVTDYLGNDKYVANMAEIDVADNKGNDSYDISNTKKTSDFTEVYLKNEFYGAGNIYNDSYYETASKSFVNILDKEGNDKYTISNIVESTNIANPIIQDYTGNDKYTLTGVRNLIIRENDNNYMGTFTGYSALNTPATINYDKKNDNDVESENKSGNDTYNISASERVTIYETSINSGNDTYNLDSIDIYTLNGDNSFINSYIYDKSGNDKYNVKNSKSVIMKDYKGADTYNITDSDRIQIIDYDTSLKLSDKYNLKGITGGYAYSSVTDYNGNEKYTISDGASYLEIKDNGGADTYTVKDSRDVSIDDKSTNDSKNINDKYNFTDYFGTDFETSLIKDDKGNETYTFNNVNTLKIDDKDGGADIYTAKNSNNIQITDTTYSTDSTKKAEKNKFNFTNCENISITTGSVMRPNALSVDTYNMISTTFNISEYDKAGDTYNIIRPKTKDAPKAANITNTSSIFDKGGDDSYKVNSITYGLKINDISGNDELIIQNAKLDNLVFMASKAWTGNSSTGGFDYDNTFYIYDKSTKGYVGIENFLADGNAQGITNQNGAGLIEKIKIGGKSFEVTSDIIAKINGNNGELYNTVAAWIIDEADCHSIGELFDSGNQIAISRIVNAFDTGNITALNG